MSKQTDKCSSQQPLPFPSLLTQVFEMASLYSQSILKVLIVSGKKKKKSVLILLCQRKGSGGQSSDHLSSCAGSSLANLDLEQVPCL